MKTWYVKPSGVELLVNDDSDVVRDYVKSLGWKKKPGPKPVDKSQETPVAQIDTKIQ